MMNRLELIIQLVVGPSLAGGVIWSSLELDGHACFPSWSGSYLHSHGPVRNPTPRSSNRRYRRAGPPLYTATRATTKS